MAKARQVPEGYLVLARKTAPEDSWFRACLERAFEIVERAEGRVADAWMPLHDQLFSTHRSTVAEALPEVFGCLKLALRIAAPSLI